jgi:hypothetical protein
MVVALECFTCVRIFPGMKHWTPWVHLHRKYSIYRHDRNPDLGFPVATHTRLIFLPRLNILRKWEDFTIFAPCRQSLRSRSSLPRMLIKVVFMKDVKQTSFEKRCQAWLRLQGTPYKMNLNIGSSCRECQERSFYNERQATTSYKGCQENLRKVVFLKKSMLVFYKGCQ